MASVYKTHFLWGMRPYLEDFRKRAAAAGVAGSGSLGQVAASFGVSQTRVSRLAGVLLSGLNRVLDQRPHATAHSWPSAWPRALLKYLPATGWSAVSCATPTRTGKRKRTALKKAHRLKNNALCDDPQCLHYPSPTETGRRHGKKIADEYPLHLPAGLHRPASTPAGRY